MEIQSLTFYLLPVLKVTGSPAVLARLVRCTSPPPGPDLVSESQKTAASPDVQTNSKL